MDVRSGRAEVEANLLASVACLSACETADGQGSHTQLLIYRQEWHELQHDLLSKVSLRPMAPWHICSGCDYRSLLTRIPDLCRRLCAASTKAMSRLAVLHQQQAMTVSLIPLQLCSTWTAAMQSCMQSWLLSGLQLWTAWLSGSVCRTYKVHKVRNSACALTAMQA